MSQSKTKQQRRTKMKFNKTNKTFEQMNYDEKVDKVQQLQAKFMVKCANANDFEALEKMIESNNAFFDNCTEEAVEKFYKELIVALI